MVSLILWAYSTVSVTIETGQGLLGEEGEGFFEDCGRSPCQFETLEGNDQHFKLGLTESSLIWQRDFRHDDLNASINLRGLFEGLMINRKGNKKYSLLKRKHRSTT